MQKFYLVILFSTIILLGAGCTPKTVDVYKPTPEEIEKTKMVSFYEATSYRFKFTAQKWCKDRYTVDVVSRLDADVNQLHLYKVHVQGQNGKRRLVNSHVLWTRDKYKEYDKSMANFYDGPPRPGIDFESNAYVVTSGPPEAVDISECPYRVMPL